jgi:hypothetical protein
MDRRHGDDRLLSEVGITDLVQIELKNYKTPEIKQLEDLSKQLKKDKKIK